MFSFPHYSSCSMLIWSFCTSDLTSEDIYVPQKIIWILRRHFSGSLMKALKNPIVSVSLHSSEEHFLFFFWQNSFLLFPVNFLRGMENDDSMTAALCFSIKCSVPGSSKNTTLNLAFKGPRRSHLPSVWYNVDNKYENGNTSSHNTLCSLDSEMSVFSSESSII